MIFFEGYAFGRIANWAHKALSRALASGGDRVPLDFHLRRALELLSRRVMDATPLVHPWFQTSNMVGIHRWGPMREALALLEAY